MPSQGTDMVYGHLVERQEPQYQKHRIRTSGPELHEVIHPDLDLYPHTDLDPSPDSEWPKTHLDLNGAIEYLSKDKGGKCFELARKTVLPTSIFVAL